ncbi:hypothetical protein [Bradyrhizobium barranii]|uniref:Uncharacterized protein n=1 Tax=Bradyrhizobium barranii subsp. barranii TaxID=2823807 RepID=A0A939M3G7_9BRAD|nr:hypothetical protein [Bradyrhizobium barranii]UEM15169.1 hypothetical protein J4G43_013610 [Bradyrhizobium barranii subsp. barranii]
MPVILPAAFIGSFSTMLGCALYWHWRVYSLYRSLGDVKRKFVDTEFSFQFQTPTLAAWLGGPMFRDKLSSVEQMQVTAVEQQLRSVRIVFAVGGYICFFGMVFALFWNLVQHGR